MGKKVSALSLSISIHNELFQALCETLKCWSHSFDWITYRMKRICTEAFVQRDGEREWVGTNFLINFAIILSRTPCSLIQKNFLVVLMLFYFYFKSLSESLLLELLSFLGRKLSPRRFLNDFIERCNHYSWAPCIAIIAMLSLAFDFFIP